MTTDVVVCHLVAMSHLVGVKKGAGRVLAPAYLGWARLRHHPHLLSTGCACWGLVTWRSSVLLVVVVSDDGRRVLLCHRVSSASSLRCGHFVVLDGCGGWLALSMVVVGRNK